jgi:hypothetical protein
MLSLRWLSGVLASHKVAKICPRWISKGVLDGCYMSELTEVCPVYLMYAQVGRNVS